MKGGKLGQRTRPPGGARVAGRSRITDRVEWYLDANTHKPISDWLNNSLQKEFRADILCCVPYLVRDNYTLRLMERAVASGVRLLVDGGSIRHLWSYADYKGALSERGGNLLQLYEFSDEQSYPDLIAYLIKSRDVKTLLIAGAADIYPILPDLKRKFKNLYVVDQIFNTTGHTRLSLTFSPYIDRYIVESHAMLDFLVQRDVKQDKISLLTSGINLNFFSRTKVDASCIAAFRSDCGFQDSVSFVVGYIGRMSPEKNPLGFLQIAREVTSRRSDIGFLIAGGGPMLDLVKDDVKRGLPDGLVSVVGFVDDVRVAMLSCDLLVVPSHVDGRPNAIMEANALGVPVLGSSIGGIGELIRNGVNGYLIRPGDYSDFASRIANIVDEHGLHGKICESSLAFAADNFDQTPMFENFKNFITNPY